MGAPLKIADLNALLDAEEGRAGETKASSTPPKKALSNAPKKRPANPPKAPNAASVDAEPVLEASPVDPAIAAMIASKPSAFQAEHRQRLRQKKALTFGQVPAFVADGFERLATEAGLTKRAYLYALLREKGVDIPSDELTDGRRL